jgi:hypothetical protein
MGIRYDLFLASDVITWANLFGCRNFVFGEAGRLPIKYRSTDQLTHRLLFPLPDQDPYILWKFTPWIASFCNASQLRLFLRSQQSFQNFVTKPHSITHHCHSPIRSPSAYILPQNNTPSLTPVQIIYETTSCAFVFTLFLEGFGFKPLPGVRPT